jgi:hypothetical protein
VISVALCETLPRSFPGLSGVFLTRSRNSLAEGRERYYRMIVVTLSFKVSEQDARAIRAQARREKVSVSQYIRQRAALPVSGLAKPGVRLCPITGARVWEAPPALPALTVATTRQMLADFP